MNFLVLAVVIVASVTLEIMLPHSPAMGRARAPVLLGVVAYYALNRGRGLMLASALLGGLLRDAVTGMPLGCSGLVLAFLGGILRAHKESFFARRFITRLALGLVLGAAFSLSMYAVLLAVVGMNALMSAPAALDKALGEGVWGMAVMPVALAFMDVFERMVGNVVTGANDSG